MLNLKRKDTIILNFSQRIAGCSQQHREHQQYTFYWLRIQTSIHYYLPALFFCLSIYFCSAFCCLPSLHTTSTFLPLFHSNSVHLFMLLWSLFSLALTLLTVLWTAVSIREAWSLITSTWNRRWRCIHFQWCGRRGIHFHSRCGVWSSSSSSWRRSCWFVWNTFTISLLPSHTQTTAAVGRYITWFIN